MLKKCLRHFSIVCSFVAELFSFYVQVAALCFVQREGNLKQNLTIQDRKYLLENLQNKENNYVKLSFKELIH
jgi:hypothetical protein